MYSFIDGAGFPHILAAISWTLVLLVVLVSMKLRHVLIAQFVLVPDYLPTLYAVPVHGS